MSLVKGICKNFGECDLADNKEVQEVDKTNFVCEECGKPLHPVDGGGGKGPDDPTKRKKKLIVIIASILVILAGAGFGIYSLLGESKIDKIMVDKKIISLFVGQNDAIKPSIVDKDGKKIKDANVVYKWVVADEQVASVTQSGEVTALKVGNTSITVKVDGNDRIFETCKVEVKDTIPAETIQESSSKGNETVKEKGEDGRTEPLPISPKVSWGKYAGPVNGLGGTITVTTSYSLDLHDDGEPILLSPGDEIQQTKFTNGELRGGVWVHDGSRRSFTR